MKYCSDCGNPISFYLEDSFTRYKCNSCHRVYYLNPKPCVAVVIEDEQQRVLLSKRIINPGRGKWDLVGGFMEINEHPYQTVEREIYEELGVQVVIKEFLGFFMDKYGENGYSTLNLAFLCHIKGKPKSINEEFDELKWFTIDNLPGEYAFDNVDEILSAYRDRDSNTKK